MVVLSNYEWWSGNMWNFNVLGNRGLLGGVALGLALTVAGCMPNPDVKAAQTLACNQKSVTHEQVAGATWVVTGCGKTDVVNTDGNKWSSLREQAAFQLSCGAGEFVITTIGNDSFGVIGCGKKALYLLVLGSFVLQSATEEGGTPAPAAPAASTPVAPAPAQ